MKSQTKLAFFGAAATFSLVMATATSGCATDPNKRVVAVDAEHTADIRDANKDRSDLVAKEETARAVADLNHEKNASAIDKNAADDSSKFDKNRDVAVASVIEQRRTYQATATARLEQVEMRTTALENKRVAKHAVEPGLDGLRARYAAVKSSVAGLVTVSDASWFATKNAVDTSLVTLEKDVHDIEIRL